MKIARFVMQNAKISHESGITVMNMSQNRANRILEIINRYGAQGVAQLYSIYLECGEKISRRTLSRTLHQMVANNLLQEHGSSRSTTYSLPVSSDLESYFMTEPSARKIIARFNHDVFKQFANKSLFTKAEHKELLRISKKNQMSRAQLLVDSPNIYKKEWERLTIDLSWKSSKIEGNTYTLLETEALILYREKAIGKSDEDVTMILNHKKAIDWIFTNQEYFQELSLRKILELHQILVGGLNIHTGIRRTPVGITGTDYRPLDNEFQIKEALEKLVLVINEKTCFFEKALIAALVIAYIQAFEDGNKRTSRLVADALLFGADYCPLSFREVNEHDYKKALIVFYEQNNYKHFKEIFIEQYISANTNYFRS